MTDMTSEQLAAIEARLAAVTPGDWFVEQIKGYCIDYVRTNHQDFQNGPSGNIVAEFGLATGQTKQQFEADAEFVSNAPTDMAALIAEINQLDKIMADILGELDSRKQQLEGK